MKIITMSNTRSFVHIFILGIALLVLLSYQYIGAAWTNPPAGAPGSNVDAPINVGTDNQIKLGDITAVHQKAGSQMWSPEYCDENGANCIDPATAVFIDAACGDGDILYRSGGTWTCLTDITQAFPSCSAGQALVMDGSSWNCVAN